MSEKELPDNYVPNAYALPYASNLSAPVIKPDHSLGGWKVGAVHSANKHYEERFNKLKKELEELAEDVKWNEIIFNAEMRMKPVIGQIYHLYKKDNEGSLVYDQNQKLIIDDDFNEVIDDFKKFLKKEKINF